MRRAFLFLPLIVISGCGGSSDPSGAGRSANPYAAVGYALLYQGTISGGNESGASLQEIPIVIGTSRDGKTIRAYGYKPNEVASTVTIERLAGTDGPFLMSRLSGTLTRLDVDQNDARVVLSGTGTEGIQITAQGSLDIPSFRAPEGSLAGRYEGFMVQKGGCWRSVNDGYGNRHR